MNAYSQTPCSFNLVSSSIGQDNQSICIMDPIIKIEYSSVILPTITGLPAGITTFRNGNLFRISGTPQQVGVYTYTITVQDASCTTNTATGTITVVDNCCTNRRLSGNEVSPAGYQNACVNLPMNPSTYDVELSSTITGLPPGLSFNTASYPPAIEGSPTQTGSFTYTLTSTGNNCNTRKTSLKISVTNCTTCQENLAPGSGLGTQTTCRDLPITPISYDVSKPTYVIGLPPGVIATYSSMVCFTAPCPGPSVEINGTPTVEGIYTYTLIPEGGNCSGSGMSTGTITVLPPNNSTTSPGCNGFVGIRGFVYHDNDNNCTKDSTDQNINNIHLKLYDENNKLLAHRYTSSGAYDFTFSDPDGGTYTVEIDTEGKGLTGQCVSPGLTFPVTVSANTVANHINFNIKCNEDIGIQSIIPTGRVFPGQQHRLKIIAGELNEQYGLICPAPGAGTMTVTVTGPVTFNGIASGAQTPTILGNEYTYIVSDWATISNHYDFGLRFTTDTTAQAGDTICVRAVLTTSGSDFEPNNNTYTFCYLVSNSYDPNLKEVFPVDIAPGFEDWLNYSIHFQNTGNAPAINIRLGDTLDGNLNLETFQVVNYSHDNSVCIYNGLLSVYFPNIELPDSASNPQGSQGFIQYRIKPKAYLPLGTQIKNTANIYFDYNPAIVTNTTVNEFKAGGMITISESEANTVYTVYPNPGTGKYFIKLLEGTTISAGTIEVYNLLGEMVLDSKVQSNITPIDLSQQPNGVYFVNLKTENGVFVQKLILNK